MKVYIADNDQTGLLIAEKEVAHTIRHYDPETKEITILMGSVIVKITMKEVAKLSMYGVIA